MSGEGRRFYVVSPNGAVTVGYDTAEVAARVAVDYGEGAHIVDTRATPYHPMAQRVENGAPIFLEHGAWDTRAPGETNLIEAVKKGYGPIVRAFLATGADVNGTDARGGTPLIWAVARGKAEVVRLLLDAGADASARDAEGMSALALARKRDRAELIEILQAAGAED